MQMLNSRKGMGDWGWSHWIFTAGIGISALAGISQGFSMMAESAVMGAAIKAILAILGIAVGIMNIDKKESMLFLIASIALSASSATIGYLGILGKYLSPILLNFSFLVGGATVIVAIAALYETMQK